MGARRVNTAVTSRQALLAASRAVARRQGLDGLSIRAVAAEAEVSVGSVYNYFSGKAELMAATVEEIWGQILSAPEAEPPEDFVSCVHGLFHRIRTGAGEYPGFFRGHAAGFLPEGRAGGRKAMEETLGQLRRILLRALEADRAVSPAAFDDCFTREQLAVMVSRYAALQGRALSAGQDALNACSDAASVSSWAQSSVAQVLNGGLLTAENGQFAPKATAMTDELANALAQL